MTLTSETDPKEAPATGPLSIEAVLAALVDVAFQDGRHEVARARGQRGTLRLTVEIVLGDHGVLQSSTTNLSFENKRHMKDGFSRERPHG